MALQRLIYVSRIALPNLHAHSIQMMRTCHALARQGVEVDFYVRGAPPPSLEAVFEAYGLEPLGQFRIHWLPPEAMEGWRFLAVTARRLRRQRAGAAIYTRDWHLARRFIRLRPLVGMPVVVETHKRDGYLELGYAGDALEEGRRSDREELIDFAYRHASGIVAAWLDTAELIRTRYPATPVLRAWFATDPLPEATYDPAARQGIWYVGNLYPHYRPDVLVDALSGVEGETLHIVGGNEEEHVAALRRRAAERGVADRLVFEGYVRPGQLRDLFGRFRVAVALLPGLKLADYFSHGLPFVAPSLRMARDLLRDGETCLLYEPCRADSMAAALRRILGDDALARRLAAGALAEARQHATADRARRLLGFIDGLL